jgi:hypothetical protein
MYSRLSRLTGYLNLATTGLGRRGLSSGSSRLASSKLGQTSVFFQTGLKICELPMVVKKVEDVLKIGESGSVAKSGKKAPAVGGLFTLTYPQEMDPETSEILSGFNRCLTSSGVFRLLETIPAEEVTPAVAVHALNRIIDFEKAASHQKETLLPGFDKKYFL